MSEGRTELMTIGRLLSEGTDWQVAREIDEHTPGAELKEMLERGEVWLECKIELWRRGRAFNGKIWKIKLTAGGTLASLDDSDKCLCGATADNSYEHHTNPRCPYYAT